MKKIVMVILIAAYGAFFFHLNAQDQPVSPSMISTAIYHDVIGPLRDFPVMTAEELAQMDQEELTKERNKELKYRNYPYWAAPTEKDKGLQDFMGTQKSFMGLIQNWEGQYSYSIPPDCNGTAGLDHYMQTVNVKYTIYDKQGALLAGPTNLNTLFSGVPGSNVNDGDPIVLFDEQAQRFLVAEFSGVSTNPDYMMIAVSQTSDPTGNWDRWSFIMNGFPDYMKFGVWRDGYYMGTNTGSGDDIYTFERDEMLAGGSSPQMVQFNNPYRPNSGFHCVLPLDNDGDFAPAGTPGGFITINDNSWGGSDELWVYQLDVDWNNPNASTFARTQQISVQPFDSYFGPTWDNIYQQGTSQRLDAINQILMHRAQYRNFNGSQHIVCNHTVDVDNTDHAGIRWYELEYNGTQWEIRQFGTYAPDGHSRWMGSIAMNANHDIALGYSVSSTSMHPSIRYTGQTAAENANASGIMDVAEVSIMEGAVSQSSYNRWGDYSNLAVDPVDEQSFWFTTEYLINSSQKGTRIANFAFASAPLADFEADMLYPETEDTVSFTDLSTGNPASWEWTFTPNTVTFHNGTTNTSQDPQLSFDVEGLYTVELTATNNVGPGTVTKTDYINAGGAIMINVTADPESVCKGNPVQLNVEAFGGLGTFTYSWSSNPLGFFSPLQDPVATPMVNTTYHVNVSDGDQTVSGSVYVAVNDFPEIILGEWPELLCNVNVPPVQLTATPEGGTYSGTGVTPDGIFYSETADIGWNVITYTYQDNNGCESAAQDSIYVDDCVGVSEIDAEATTVNLYPNPSAGFITLESDRKIERIEIFDQTGRMVMMRKIDGKTTSLSALRAKGTYFLRVYIEQENALPTLVTREFIIN